MKLGIAVDKLGISQLALVLIDELNKVSKLEQYLDIVVFYHRYDVLLKSPFFGMFQEQLMWGFDGPVIATNLNTMHTLLSCPKPTSKYFYIWDLEWMHHQYDYEFLLSIYCNDQVELIARSEEHAKVIENCWKKPIDILEDFNYEKLTSIIN